MIFNCDTQPKFRKKEISQKNLSYSPLRLFYRVIDNAGTRTSVSELNDRVTDFYVGKSSSDGAQTNVKYKLMSLAIWKKSLSASEINEIYIFGLYKIILLPFIALLNASKGYLRMQHFHSAKMIKYRCLKLSGYD